MIIEKTVFRDANARATRVIERTFPPVEDWVYQAAAQVHAVLTGPTFRTGSRVTVYHAPPGQDLAVLSDAIIARLPADPGRAGQSCRLLVTTAAPPGAGGRRVTPAV